MEERQETTFIGLDAVRNIQYRTTRNEDTRCNFCKNNCLRTFIDINTGGSDTFVPLLASPRFRCAPASSASLWRPARRVLSRT